MVVLHDIGGKLSKRPGRGGFTLVELLIVTVIIGIVAGMMMITMGAATDSATAIRLVNDLRLLKIAGLQYFAENDAFPGEDLPDGGYAAVAKSLERYYDKPLMNGYGGVVYVARSNDKMFYGLKPDDPSAFGHGALKKLEVHGNVYNGQGNQFKAGSGHDAGPFYAIIK